MTSLYTAFRRLSAALAVLCASCMIAACGGSLPEVPPAQRYMDQDYNYVIGPGDTMEIFVWGNEELTTTGVVRPDGKFTTRLVADVDAFDGHIACASSTRSELVIPVFDAANQLIAVFDIDSDQPDAFDHKDAEALTAILVEVFTRR